MKGPKTGYQKKLPSAGKEMRILIITLEYMKVMKLEIGT